MFYKIIIFFIVGLGMGNLYKTDLYFYTFLTLLSGISYVLYGKHKGHLNPIKDTHKTMSFMFFIVAFFIGVHYIQTSTSISTHSSNCGETNSSVEIVGIVTQVSQTPLGKNLLVRIDKELNLANNLYENSYPEYVNVSVSQYNMFSKFDKLQIIGNVTLNNWQIYKEERPLFFNYELSSLQENSVCNVSDVKNISKINYDKNYWETFIFYFNETSLNLKSQIPKHMKEPYSQIAQGISLGDQENIIKDIKDIFRKSGLIHIMVLSGANLSFIISIVYFLIRRTGKKFKAIFTVLFSWVFIFFTGLTAPSARAGIMSNTNILGEFFGRNISPTQSLIFSIFILTLINPNILFTSPSFHLSFLACFGLFVAGPKIEKYFKKNNFSTSVLSSGLGVFIFVTPYLLALVGTVNLFGTIFTIAVEPLVLLSTIFSFLIIFFSYILGPVADLFGILNSICVKLILDVATFGASNLPTINYRISLNFLLTIYVILFAFFSRSQNGIIDKKL